MLGLLGTVGGGERLRGLTFAADLAVAPAATVYAITSANELLRFTPATPGTVVAVPIAGLQTNETVLAIDFRPATGVLYALGSAGRLYTLEAGGVATFVATLSADPADTTSPCASFAGEANYGLDFNPMVDRLRVVADDEQNLRIVPTNGLTTTGLLSGEK